MRPVAHVPQKSKPMQAGLTLQRKLSCVRLRPVWLKKRMLPSWRCNPKMVICQLRGNAPAGRSIEEADLDQKWFVDIFDSIGILG